MIRCILTLLYTLIIFNIHIITIRTIVTIGTIVTVGRFITENKSTILYTAIYMRKERSKMHTLRKVKKKNRRGVAI